MISIPVPPTYEASTLPLDNHLLFLDSLTRDFKKHKMGFFL